MREKRAVRNIITNIILQCALALSGLIIPRLIMHFYGSDINGMVSSISQFIVYASLIELGIGNASIVALYSPIAKGDFDEISSIMTGSKKLYFTSGYIYSIFVLGIAFTYPLLYAEQLDYWFIFSLVICIGSVNAVDYFFLSKYKVLLTADQKYYILNIARIVSTFISIAGSAVLLINGKNVVWVKGLVLISHMIEAFMIHYYVRKHYPLIKFNAIRVRKVKQRWNALIHQLCATVVYNTDIVVLTFCLPGHSLYEISVYSVYLMVLNIVSNMTSTLTTGINATFGDMFVKGEKKKLYEVFDTYEFCFFIVLFSLYSCFLTLILPFVHCYTKGMQDVNYVRLHIGILFALNGLISQIKDASGTVIKAAGKYKETQRYAIEEAVINISISLMLVDKFGITGVLIGTLISHIWMMWRMMSYMSRELIVGSGRMSLLRVLRNCILMMTITIPELHFIYYPDDFMSWILEAAIIAVINILSICTVNLMIEKKKIASLKSYLFK